MAPGSKGSSPGYGVGLVGAVFKVYFARVTSRYMESARMFYMVYDF